MPIVAQLTEPPTVTDEKHPVAARGELAPDKGEKLAQRLIAPAPLAP